MYALLYVIQIANAKLLYNTRSSTWCSMTTERGGMGWEVGSAEVQEGGNICTPMADSCCYMAETDTTL